IAYWLLDEPYRPIDSFDLPIAYCLLDVGSWLLAIGCWLLDEPYRPIDLLICLLPIACWMLAVGGLLRVKG
ncbi:MAG: hypothetical protein WD431_04380, partial [Cyclobacteriaceae bacterium]